jgi:hypothetical protein
MTECRPTVVAEVVVVHRQMGVVVGVAGHRPTAVVVVANLS